MGSEAVNVNVNPTSGVNRGFAGVADIMDALIIPCLTLVLAYIHLYYLINDTLIGLSLDVVANRTQPWLPKNKIKILMCMIVSFALLLIVIVIPAMVLKILDPIIQTDGLHSGNTNFQNFFNQVFLYYMAAVGLIGGWYFDASRDCAENLHEHQFAKRTKINVAYLVVFELYNLYTYISPGNVLLIGYVIGTLILSSAHVCNKVASTPYFKESDKRNEIIVSNNDPDHVMQHHQANLA
jgi:hypothetical protein